MRKLCLALATGFGLGLSPIASGTAGALLGVAIGIGMAPLGVAWQAALALVLALLAIPICDRAEKIYGTKDDRRIVADEYLTFPICLLGLPWMDHPTLLAWAFVTNRVLDIIKPPPARQAQSIRGGTGVVLDDVISSFYALLANHAIRWLLYR